MYELLSEIELPAIKFFITKNRLKQTSILHLITEKYQSSHSKSDLIPFSLRPNTGIRVGRCAVIEAESEKNKPVETVKRETPCSISLKLSVLEKEVC